MAVQRAINTISLDSDRGAVFRIREPDLARLEQHLFQRYPEREWGTFFSFGYRRTPWGLLISYVDGLWPEAGDLDRTTALTTFREQYSRRAFHAARGVDGLAIGVVHSHPRGYATRPSPLDDDMDSHFAQEFNAYGRGAPYCSLIFQRNETAGLTFSGRACDRGRWHSVKTTLAVGTSIRRFESELVTAPQSSLVADRGVECTTERLQQVLGAPSRLRLQASTVAVIGCSGTGSPAVETLVRAGVGNLVLVDPDRLSASNLERLHGSTWSHLQQPVKPFKVEILRELALSINPEVRVTAFVGNVLHENVVDELVRCDAVLGCTDTVHGRVALGDLANLYLVPSLDVGVRMNGSAGRVTEQLIEFNLLAPGLPCPFCGGRVNPDQLAYELMSEHEREARRQAAEAARRRGDDADQYWRGRPRQLHTVGYLTTAAGAIAAGYVEGLLTGTFELPHTGFQFDLGCERFGFVTPPQEHLTGCNCRHHLGWAEQGRAYKNVSIPDHWPRRAMLLPSTSPATSSGPKQLA